MFYEGREPGIDPNRMGDIMKPTPQEEADDYAKELKKNPVAEPEYRYFVEAERKAMEESLTGLEDPEVRLLLQRAVVITDLGEAREFLDEAWKKARENIEKAQ
jgi:hypothetical protein